ncbi:hypothetical protein GQR58_028554 [Nymphon striatum]|nr:hypothetical protein GQR58_028554 [Nymphon striatum]
MVNSGIIWPDLDTNRIVAVTPSEGFALDRQNDTEADVFFLTLDPGAVITLIAEQRTDKLPKLYLWEPSAYKDTANSYTLYYGIVLGISGLLAVFLTILFVVKGSAMFPATCRAADWYLLSCYCVSPLCNTHLQAVHLHKDLSVIQSASALALTGAGDILWDWDVNRDKISADYKISTLLKQDNKLFNTSSTNWQKLLHPNDRDRLHQP